MLILHICCECHQCDTNVLYHIRRNQTITVGRAPEAYGSHHVCPSVCVCVILQRTFLHDGNKLSNESFNATTAQHSTTAKLARLIFVV